MNVYIRVDPNLGYGQQKKGRVRYCGVFFQTNIQYLKAIAVTLCVHEYLVRGRRYWVMLACGFICVHIQLYDFSSFFPLFGGSAFFIFSFLWCAWGMHI